MLLRAASWALALTGAAASAHLDSAYIVRDPYEDKIRSVLHRRQQATATTSGAPSATGTPGAGLKGCAAVGAAYVAAVETGEDSVEVPPSVAYACLESVPVDVERDIGLIEWLLPYMSFQSTLGYLKKPPQEYLLPGVDIVGGLAAIREKLRKGGYESQWEFTTDLNRVYAASADGHFGYQPALDSAFLFLRDLNFTSLSTDGIELPKIYLTKEVSAVAAGKASDVVSVNDVPILDFLYELAAVEQMQDPDSQYNTLFHSLPSKSSGGHPRVIHGKPQSGRIPDVYTLEFSNGSTREIPTRAVVSSAIWLNATTGEDLHQLLEVPTGSLKWTPPTEGEENEAAHHIVVRQEDEETFTSVPYYPVPVAIHQHGYMSGYFLNDTQAHDDTAVLVISSFQPANDSLIAPTQTAEILRTRKFVREFLDACAKAGRTKLVIDVSGNGGGLVYSAFEVYKNLFPAAKAWSGSRLRAHPALDYMGRVAYDTVNEDIVSARALNPATGERYPTWKDYYGPHRVGEDRATSLLIYDFANDSLTDTGSGFLVTGFGKDVPKQPFAKEDVVVMTDGYCGSSCTIFTGLLQREAGVRTIALGGRPLKAPMQAVGGVKGSQVLNVQALQQYWNGGMLLTNMSQLIDPKHVVALPTDMLPPLLPHTLARVQVNSRNAYAEDSTDGFPTHFRYEAANCRRFNKPEYITDFTVAWADVADVAWHGAKCAPGSTVDKDGNISDEVPGYSDAVRARVGVYDGPGSLTNQEWLSLAGNLTGSPEGIPGIEEDVVAEGDKKSGAGRTVPAVVALVVGLLAVL
ncbi:hypothetical protein OQA88_11503 [Cercophora sp. LCS_1]